MPVGSGRIKDRPEAHSGTGVNGLHDIRAPRVPWRLLESKLKFLVLGIASDAIQVAPNTQPHEIPLDFRFLFAYDLAPRIAGPGHCLLR
jgi:hypothetical protein